MTVGETGKSVFMIDDLIRTIQGLAPLSMPTDDCELAPSDMVQEGTIYRLDNRDLLGNVCVALHPTTHAQLAAAGYSDRDILECVEMMAKQSDRL